MATATAAPTEKRTATAIRFPSEVHAELERAAGGFGLSVNYLVVQAVREFLSKHPEGSTLEITRY